MVNVSICETCLRKPLESRIDIANMKATFENALQLAEDIATRPNTDRTKISNRLF